LWLLRHRPAPALEEPLTPAQRVLRDLDEIAALRLPEQGRYREHYELLSATLRRYVAERCGAAPGRTTRELRSEMERAGLDREHVATILEILREGEVVRFRDLVPYPARAQAAVRSALAVFRKAATAEQYEAAPIRQQ
ncbi:MAG: hypothetical protein ACRDF0_02415, partial [Candidatus Limnocylindria bacterium]